MNDGSRVDDDERSQGIQEIRGDVGGKGREKRGKRKVIGGRRGIISCGGENNGVQF